MTPSAIGFSIPPVILAALPNALPSVVAPTLQRPFQTAPITFLSRQDRRNIQHGLFKEFETALRDAAHNREARITLGRFLQNRHFLRLFLRKSHIPLLLVAAETTPVLLNMAIDHRPSLFTLEHLAQIRAISPWAAMRLIAKRSDWQMQEGPTTTAKSPYERAHERHERDVRTAQERRRKELDLAGALISIGMDHLASGLLEGTA